jgi:putative methyltransferase (TIGR04325 family)
VVEELESPYDVLLGIIEMGFEFFIFDRTCFNMENRDRITLQVVPENIYNASYPAWFLDKERFFNLFKKQYSLVESFECHNEKLRIDGKESGLQLGMIFERKTPPDP